MKNTELSTSESVAIKINETWDDIVDAEEAIYFDDFTITGEYTDDDILDEERKLYQKTMKFGSKLKNWSGKGGYCYFLIVKKKRIENIWK